MAKSAFELSEELKLGLALVVLIAIVAGIALLFGGRAPAEGANATNATPSSALTPTPAEGVATPTPVPTEGAATPTPGLVPTPSPTPSPMPTPDLSRCQAIANPVIREEATGG